MLKTNLFAYRRSHQNDNKPAESEADAEYAANTRLFAPPRCHLNDSSCHQNDINAENTPVRLPQKPPNRFRARKRTGWRTRAASRRGVLTGRSRGCVRARARSRGRSSSRPRCLSAKRCKGGKTRRSAPRDVTKTMYARITWSIVITSPVPVSKTV